MLQLLTVMPVGIPEVLVAIDPVEIEVSAAHRPEQVLNRHDFVKLLPVRRCGQRSGVRFDGPQRGVERSIIGVFGHGSSVRT